MAGTATISVLAGMPSAQPQRYHVGVSFPPAVIQAILKAEEVPAGGFTAIVAANLRVMRRSRDPEAGGVVFTDIAAPGTMNGLDLRAWCRQHRPGMAVVVATSYYEQTGDLPQEVVRKPYLVDDVVRHLQRACERPEQRRPDTEGAMGRLARAAYSRFQRALTLLKAASIWAANSWLGGVWIVQLQPLASGLSSFVGSGSTMLGSA